MFQIGTGGTLLPNRPCPRMAPAVRVFGTWLEAEHTQEAKAIATSLTRKERRRRPRAKLSLSLYVRPSDTVSEHFEEVSSTLDTARDSFYFLTASQSYRRGMRLFVTFPYNPAVGALNRDYVGEVVRVERCADGRSGVAVRLLTSLHLHKYDSCPD